MSVYINHNNGTIYSDCTVTIQNGATQPTATVHPNADQAEEVQPIDTSFFCTRQFAEDIIEKNIRQAIEMASSKADACRRLMSLETQGYIRLSDVKDERKAELLNPFATPKFTFTGEDFKKSRNRPTN